MSERIAKDLSKISKWENDRGLGVSPEKTELVVFYRKRRIFSFTLPSINEQQLTLADSTKFLGVILDSKFLSNKNIESTVRKAQIGISGSLKSTPTDALFALLGIHRASDSDPLVNGTPNPMDMQIYWKSIASDLKNGYMLHRINFHTNYKISVKII